MKTYLIPLLALFSLSSIQAGTVAPPSALPPLPTEDTIFGAGEVEWQSGLGMFWSFTPDDSQRPDIDYTLSAYRLGFMLSNPNGHSCWRGNTELLLEGFYGSVTEGPGDWLAGGTILLRYNFIQPSSRWIPYIQIGAGGLWNDIYKDQSQDLIGQSFEFNLQAAIGLRYQHNQRWAAAIEGGYRHISNADNAERNTGLDSAGVMLSLIYSF